MKVSRYHTASHADLRTETMRGQNASALAPFHLAQRGLRSGKRAVPRLLLVLAFALVLLAFPSDSKAAIALVRSSTGLTTNGGNVSATYSGTPAAGNLLIAIVGSDASVTINVPAGWSSAINQSQTGTPSQAIFFKVADGTESTVTVTTGASNAEIGLQIYEYSGTAVTNPLDGAPGSSTGTGTAISTGSVTGKAFTNDLMIAGVTSNFLTSFSSWTNGFSEQHDFQADGPGSGSNNATFGGAHLLVSGAVTSTSTTAADSATWRGQIAAFKALAPTDVAMVSLKATRYDGRVLLEWQTGYEINNVGFNIYREENGSLKKLTPEPVAGSALMAGPGILMRTGFAYSWWDISAKDVDDASVRYWLEDIDVSGRLAMQGPYGIEQSFGNGRVPPPGKGKVSLLSALGRDASEKKSAESATLPVERMAGIVKMTPALMETQAAVASSPSVKLSVQHEGYYRVEQPQIVAAGLPASVDPRKLQLFVDGVQVPIIVTGERDGRFDPADGVEFYGVGINSVFTANHIYWLVAGATNGLRVKIAAGKGGTPIAASFPYTVERRDKVIYFAAVKNDGGEKFYGPLILNAQPVDQSLMVSNVAGTGGNATLEVSLQGLTLAPHFVRVLFNGAEVAAIQFDGQTKGTASASIPQSSLLEGSNQVQLIGPLGFGDMSLVEYVRLTYQHTNNADGNALRFPVSGKQSATIGGFTNSSIRVFDVSDSNSVQELDATVKQTGATFSVSAVSSGSGARTLFAFAADQQRTPTAMTLDQPSSWRATGISADYLLITRKDLVNSMQPLVSHRQRQGLKTALVDVGDLYDEFSFGNKTPQALKDFISYAKGNWKVKPRFVTLAGDATFDPKDYMGLGDNDVVPTKLVETNFNETATDDWFVDVNNDGVPDAAVGRLPVRATADASELVSKIVSYDQSEPIDRVLLVADNNDGFDFEAADTQLQSVIPGNLTVTDIRRGQIGDSNARSQLLDAINQGQKVVNFYGHGSVLVWTNAPILTASDVVNFANSERLSLFVGMTCLNGLFQDVSIAGLAEALLKSHGGAIAVWASSGMTDPAAQVQMNQTAFQKLFSGAGLSIGEVTSQAKAATGNNEVRRTWILFGDPATKLK